MHSLLQEFQYFVVIDFEATCDETKIPQPQEIIEFPSVLVNSATGELEASFQTYVRPKYHPLLTDFCKELTGIQQVQVDGGVALSEALLMHDEWLEQKGIKHRNFAVVTWSNWDCRVMLESECRFKGIKKPFYFNRWINLKVPFGKMFKGGFRCKLKEAVQMAGLPWVGRLHCGLDDACNTARLLVLLMHRGFKFSITNALMCEPSDYAPKTLLQMPMGMARMAPRMDPQMYYWNSEVPNMLPPQCWYPLQQAPPIVVLQSGCRWGPSPAPIPRAGEYKMKFISSHLATRTAPRQVILVRKQHFYASPIGLHHERMGSYCPQQVQGAYVQHIMPRVGLNNGFFN